MLEGRGVKRQHTLHLQIIFLRNIEEVVAGADSEGVFLAVFVDKGDVELRARGRRGDVAVEEVRSGGEGAGGE